MDNDRMTWQDVRLELYREYQVHDGYLPHHAEREWAPRLGIKPNTLRTKFTTDLGRICAEHANYRLSKGDMALIKRIPGSHQAYERLRSRGRAVPPFADFVQALWRARSPSSEVIYAAFARCKACMHDEAEQRRPMTPSDGPATRNQPPAPAAS